MSRKLNNIELDSDSEWALANASVIAVERKADVSTNNKLLNFALKLLGEKIKKDGGK